MDQENNTTSNRAAGKSTAATSAWRELHASSQCVGCGGDRPPDATVVRLQTEDRGGPFGIAPGKAAVSGADLQDVAPPQPAQALENTNLGLLGIKRVDHATLADFVTVECYELACSAWRCSPVAVDWMATPAPGLPPFAIGSRMSNWWSFQ